jgi:transcriptional regulator with XRE-family HTH domain
MRVMSHQIGEGLGLTFQQVQKYESGKNRISASRIQRIAVVLGVDPEFFFKSVTGVGDDVLSDTIRQFVVSNDGLNLMNAFTRIRSREFQRRLVQLVERIAETSY